MSNEPNLETMSLEERARLRKQMSDQAVKLAVSSRWLEAANLNREYVRTFGDEAEAYNRLGKALTELGQVADARDAYGKALDLDSTNTIARRNLDRLATMKETAAAAAAPSQLDTRLFVEETGTATLAKLQATNAEISAVLDAGDIVNLQVQGNAVNVLTVNGEYVGMVEPRIGLRLSKMMTAGNRYSAAMVTTSGELKVMLRETFKHPSLIDKVSFPTGRASEIRAYTRKGLLRRDDEDEIEFGDDEYVEEESDEGWSETGEELGSGSSGIDVNSDDEGFD
ncbi:MAG: tetratricopeptide repeat protein [Chloroflexi bacterium]|nr:tetratricopeptide repeat protein [Dehalococcoidia bacterium]NJD66525.1 tetratricopeptide repeat protein [Chloroflexota bacterium]